MPARAPCWPRCTATAAPWCRSCCSTSARRARSRPTPSATTSRSPHPFNPAPRPPRPAPEDHVASTTIDYGIDLGTTNSAIARQRGAAPELYRGPGGETILPSAVHVSAGGQETLGRAALAALDADPANVAIE